LAEQAAVQIEADKLSCPACGGRLDFFPVFHHMMCAYIGPQYDFLPAPEGFTCPKCRRPIASRDEACEIVATSARCSICSKEMVVSPPVRAR